MSRTKAWPLSRFGVAGHVALLAGHVITVFTGFVYFISPSPSLEAVLDSFWVAAWSVIFVVFGAAAFYSRFRRFWVAESISLFAISGGLLIWGAVVIYATLQTEALNGLQTGVRFIGGAVILIGFAFLELEWVRLKKPDAAVVKAITKELQRRESES